MPSEFGFQLTANPIAPLLEPEVEQLTGLEVNGLYIGDWLSGCFRRSVGNPTLISRQLLSQLAALILAFVLCLPLGFAGLGGHAPGPSATQLLRFVQWPAIVSGLLFMAWQLSLRRQGDRLGRLLLLLEEVDRYNQVIAAVELLGHLQSLNSQSFNSQSPNPAGSVGDLELSEGLDLTRQTLVVALQTDRLLRQALGKSALLLQPGLMQIEENLLQLRSIEVAQQGQETAELIGQALAIGLRVRSELDPRAVRDR
jgi:hypothetical protein